MGDRDVGQSQSPIPNITALNLKFANLLIIFVINNLGKDMIAQEALSDEYLQLSAEELDRRIERAKKELGNSVIILGHHYQRDEIIKFADYRGDSFKLSQLAAKHKDVNYIIFCGVHFMAESADILSNENQIVILPDMEAGCSMADMASMDQVLECWDYINDLIKEKIIPITYMNSSAALKAFCGKHNGSVCTSSNAIAVFKWAFSQANKILFFPDEHLGRNTAYKLGISLDELVVWDPEEPNGGLTEEEILKSRIILWKGFCSVHMQFNEQQIYSLRSRYPDIKIIVHPECRFEVVQLSDFVGSTEYIINKVTESKDIKKWGVGTEIHLVNRLAKDNPDKYIVCLNNYFCLCATMFRISPQRLLWSMENLLQGRIVNQIKVSPSIKRWAIIALDRMLSIT